VLPALAGFHVLSQLSGQLRLEPDGRKDRLSDFVLVHPDRRTTLGAVPCPGAAFIIGPCRLFMHWSQSTNAAFQFSIKERPVLSFLLDGFSCCLGFSLPRLRFYPRFPAPGKCQLALCRVKLFLRDDTFKRMRDHDPLRRVAS